MQITALRWLPPGSPIHNLDPVAEFDLIVDNAFVLPMVAFRRDAIGLDVRAALGTAAFGMRPRMARAIRERVQLLLRCVYEGHIPPEDAA